MGFRRGYNQNMRLPRPILLFFLLPVLMAHAADGLLCGTWNLRWFPSGIADCRGTDAEEAGREGEVGRFLQSCLRSIESDEEKPLVLFFQEVRDATTCSNLVDAMGMDGLSVACVSDYRDQAGFSIWQQDAVFTTLPVLEARSVVWHSSREDPLPRGYAYALLDGGTNGPIAAFSIHLKSNLTASGLPREKQRAIFARERAASEILAKLRSLRHVSNLRVVVGGDFNTDSADGAFVSEKTLRSFYGAHFRSCFTDVKLEERITHPASGGYPDATFDYILSRGFRRVTGRYLFPGKPYSDHNPVFVELPFP